jgi:hypothetical protein
VHKQKKYHCKSSSCCHRCGDPICFEDYSKNGESLAELELRVSEKTFELCSSHKCPPRLKVSIPIPSECQRCGYEFKTSEVFFGKHSEKEIRELEMHFVGKTMLYQKEHRKACIANHTQTRFVLIEKNKNAIKKNKKRPICEL